MSKGNEMAVLQRDYDTLHEMWEESQRRVEELEHERDEARAEVEALKAQAISDRAQIDHLDEGCGQYEAEIERQRGLLSLQCAAPGLGDVDDMHCDGCVLYYRDSNHACAALAEGEDES